MKSKFKIRSIFVFFSLCGAILIFGITSDQKVSADKFESHRTNNQHLPNLSGDDAENYLKEQGLYESLGEAMQAARYAIYPAKNSPVEDKRALHANNPRQGYSTYFSTDGIHLVSNAKDNKWKIAMNLEQIGHGKELAFIESGELTVQKNKSNIEIEKFRVQSSEFRIREKNKTQNLKPKIVEWYKNAASGLEQGWTISEKFAETDEELKLVLSVESGLKMKLAADGQAIDFIGAEENDSPVVRYDKLKSWDADGQNLASRMELDDGRLAIVVDDRKAKYPITVDPFFTQTKKLTATDAAADDEFGGAVAISGNTAIVGAEFDDAGGNDSGSAYIFERNIGGANMWSQAAKLTASDGAALDEFGRSVAISGEWAVVGASDKVGSSTFPEGAAYIFRRTNGGVNNWLQDKKITASDAASGDNFGGSVGISGDTIIIGAFFNDDAGTNSGSAYIFERNTGGLDNWGEVRKLTASDADIFDKFGGAVAISGDTAIVGAEDGSEISGTVGSAYIFERNTGGVNNWGEVRKLIASDVADGDNFGEAVAISGNTAVVGASDNDDAGNFSGSAYIFKRNSGGADNWGEVKKLTASNAFGGDQFGEAVAISNDTLIIGAGLTNRSGFNDTGSAYIFERNMGGTDNWGEVQELIAFDAGGSDRFGNGVAISGDTIIVGAPQNDDDGNNSGSAYIYTNQFDNWQEVRQRTSPNGEADDQFGSSVAISGDVAIVGAQFDDVGGNSNQGSAYIFERNVSGGNNWGAVTNITASDGAADDEFGNSVGISGETVVIGAHFDDFPGAANQGSAYVFERNSGGAGNWGAVKKLVSADAGPVDRFGESVGISGDTVIVGAQFNNNAAGDTGAAYIFGRNKDGADNWGEVQKLTATDAAALASFGFSVAISNDTAIVGAYGSGIEGAAYVFERNTDGTDNWGQLKKLTASDQAPGDLFGYSVAISGETAIVGAYRNDGGGNESGSAYIFERNANGSTDGWSEVRKITASDDVGFERFGFSVGISGNRAIVGAYDDDDGITIDVGSAYIFERNMGGAENWGEVRKLAASNPENNDNFGYSVAISGDTIIASAPFKDIPTPLTKNLSGKSFRNATDNPVKTSQNLAGANQGAMYIFNALAAPTAASAHISGRVLNQPGGRGVPNAIVHLTDQDGNIRSARTNPFGYFRIEDIEVGQSLILNVFSKRYQFDTQVINLKDSINGLTITAH